MLFASTLAILVRQPDSSQDDALKAMEYKSGPISGYTGLASIFEKIKERTSENSPKGRYSIVVKPATETRSVRLNPDILFAAIQKNAITIDSSTTPFAKLDPAFAKSLFVVYGSLPKKNKPIRSAEDAFKLARVVKTTDTDTRFNSIYSSELAHISFGRPLAYSAREKHLVIPPSIARDFDVYWIDFAVSSDELTSEDASEFKLLIRMPKSFIALMLVPLRYGTEEQIATKKAIPNFTIGSVSLGEAYGQTIEYKSLRPTVLATGLQERTFGWIIKGDMIDQGTKRFSGIVGVPKGTGALPVSMMATAQLRGWFGLMGDTSGTEQVTAKITLHR